MNLKITLFAGAVVVAVASIACTAPPAGSADSDLTKGDTTKKGDTKKTPAKTPAAAASANPEGTDAGASVTATAKGVDCLDKCLGSNAAALKLSSDDNACYDKCPAIQGAEKGGGGSAAEGSDAVADPCSEACDKSYDSACAANKPACDAVSKCEDQCAQEPSSSENGGGSGGSGSGDTNTGEKSDE